jgi:hypothetical protein
VAARWHLTRKRARRRLAEAHGGATAAISMSGFSFIRRKSVVLSDVARPHAGSAWSQAAADSTTSNLFNAAPVSAGRAPLWRTHAPTCQDRPGSGDGNKFDGCLRPGPNVGRIAAASLHRPQRPGRRQDLGELGTKGLDLSINYRMPKTAWGSFGFKSESTYVDQYRIKNTGTADFVNYAGEYGTYRVSSTCATTRSSDRAGPQASVSFS